MFIVSMVLCELFALTALCFWLAMKADLFST